MTFTSSIVTFKKWQQLANLWVKEDQSDDEPMTLVKTPGFGASTCG
jgi:hypothetical protein